MTAVGIRVLGSLCVEVDGRDRNIGSETQRRLLVVLVAQRGRVLAVDRLVEALWGDAAPITAKATLQTYVHRLRSLLGPGIILTRSPGYVLDPAAVMCDAAEFEALCATERDAVSSDAVSLADRALRMWRGPAFAGFEGEELCRPEAVHLEELRVSLQERRIEALIDSGGITRAVAEAERFCAEHPLRENAQGALMQALAAANRVAEALRAYATYRQRLAEETGLVPSSALRLLERRLIESLDEPPMAAPTTGHSSEEEALRSSKGRAIDDELRDASLISVNWISPRMLGAGSSRSTVLQTRRQRASAMFEEVLDNHGGALVEIDGLELFGVVSDARDAVLVAIELQQALAHDRERYGIAGVGRARIAVVRGGVNLGAGSMSGGLRISEEDLQRASQLAAMSGSGEVLVSADVRAAAQGLENVTFHEHSTLDTEHLDVATPWVVEPASFPDLASRLGCPARLLRHQATMHGRDVPQEEILATLNDAARGVGTLVFVVGPAGIGKTSLLASVASTAVERGWAVMFGSCHREVGGRYEPFAMALRDIVERHPLHEAITGPHRRALDRVVRPFGPAAVGADDDEAVATVVLHVLRSLAAEVPVLVVLDDLHWADPSTVAVLDAIIAGVVDRRVVILVAARSFEATANEPLDSLMDARSSTLPTKRVKLQGITIEAVRAMAQQAGVDGDDGLAEFVLQRTGGNPYLVRELLALGPAAARRSGVPDDLHRAVAGRLSILSGPCRRLLEVAAVAGAEFDPVTLTAAVDLPPEVGLDLFDEAVRAGILREPGGDDLRLAFDHDLLRESLLSSTTQLRQRHHHRSIGLALERRGADLRPTDLAELARHFTAAAPLNERNRACQYNAAAAASALDANANATAAELYAKAIEFSSDDVRRIELMTGRGEALRRQGDPSAAELLASAAALADRVGAHELQARAALTDYRGTFGLAFAVDEARVRRLRRALARVGDQPSPVRAELLVALAVELVWSPSWEESLDLADRALAIARSCDDERLLAKVLQLRQWVSFHPTSDRLVVASELALLTRDGPDLSARFEAAGHASFTYLRAGALRNLEESIELARWIARRIDRPVVDWMMALRESPIAMLRCRFDDAAALIAQSASLGRRTGQPDAALQSAVQTFWLNYEVAPLDAQRTEMIQLLRLREHMAPLTWPSLAFRCMEVGMHDEARSVLAAIAPGIGQRPRDQVWLWNGCQLAALAARYEPSWTPSLYADLEPHADEVANTVFGTVGPVSRSLGLLAAAMGRPEQALGHYRRALAVAERIVAPSWAARISLDMADLLDAVGGDEGRLLRNEARATARALGLPLVSDRAEAALAYQRADAPAP